MVKKLCQIAEIPTFEERKVALYDCNETTKLNYAYTAYAKLWEELGIANCMRSIQDNYYGLKEAELQHLYHALDKLCDEKEFVESQLFEQNYRITGQKVVVVFYDVTTFAFQSVIADDLRNFSFSKDCKFSEVQISLDS